MEEYDQFVGKIVKQGNSLAVNIPTRNIEFSGLKEGDYLKVSYKKKQEETAASEDEEEVQ